MDRRYGVCVGLGLLGLSLAIAAVLAGCNGATLTVVQNEDGGGGGHTPGIDSGVKTNGDDGGHSPVGPAGDDSGPPVSGVTGDDGGPVGDEDAGVDDGGPNGLCIPDGGITFTMNLDTDASSVCFMGSESPGSCDGWFGISDFSRDAARRRGRVLQRMPRGARGGAEAGDVYLGRDGLPGQRHDVSMPGDVRRAGAVLRDDVRAGSSGRGAVLRQRGDDVQAGGVHVAARGWGDGGSGDGDAVAGAFLVATLPVDFPGKGEEPRLRYAAYALLSMSCVS